MLKDQMRATDPDRPTLYASTIVDNGIVLAANPLARRTPVWLPEISLVAAVFKDAVRCVQRAGGGVTHQQSSEAIEWIASERSDWPFAFVNVCDFLGMDANAVRKCLRVGSDVALRETVLRVVQ